MLVPHGREDTHLCERRRTANNFEDTRIFFGAQPMCGDKVGRNHWILQVVIPQGAKLPSDTKDKGRGKGWNGF